MHLSFCLCYVVKMLVKMFSLSFGVLAHSGYDYDLVHLCTILHEKSLPAVHLVPHVFY